MSQRSKPTERVVRVLELLRTSPAGLRFSELARAGDLSQGTCHAILGALVDAGYVVRDAESLTYSLGPGALALGTAAVDAHADVRGARSALVDLAARTGLAVSVAKVVGGDITVVDVVAAPGCEPPIRVGARVPFAPPFGAIHVAWSGDAAIRAWIGRSARADLAASRLLAVVRDHQQTRVAVAPYTATSTELRAALSALAADARSDAVRERTLGLLSAIDEVDFTREVIEHSDRLPVNTITSPVFDADGATAHAVGLHLGDPDVTTTRVRSLFAELLAVAEELTERRGGHLPEALEPAPVLASIDASIGHAGGST